MQNLIVLLLLANPWNWTFVGPRGGEFFWALSHPDANNFAAALSMGDVWRTTDGGVNWELSFENSLPVAGMFSSPNAGIIVDYTGEVWVTLDAGVNWTSVLTTNHFHAASFDVIDTVIYLADSIPPRLWRSTNSGLTWQVITVFDSLYSVDQIAHIPGSPSTYWLVGHTQDNDTLAYIYFSGTSSFVDTIVAGEVDDFQENPADIWHTLIATDHGIYQATSGTGPWVQLAEPFAYGLYQPIDIEFTGDDTIVVSSMFNPGIFRGVRIAGVWIFTQTENREGCGYMNFGGATTLYCGSLGSGVFKSTDDGNSWTIQDGLYGHLLLSAGAVSEIIDSTFYFIGFGGKPFKTTDWGTTWTPLSHNFLIYGSAIEVAPTNPNFLIVSAMDIETVGSPPMTIYRSTDGGTSWSPVDSTYAAADFLITSNPDIIMGITDTVVIRSTSGGNGFSPVLTAANNFYNLTGRDTVFVASRDSTYVSYDQGATWSFLVDRGGTLTYDSIRDILYIVAEQGFYTFDVNTGTLDSLSYNCLTASVSPNGNLYFLFVSDTLRIARSFDGGNTIEEEVFPIPFSLSGGIKAGDDGVFCYQGIRGLWVSNDITSGVAESKEEVCAGTLTFAPTIIKKTQNGKLRLTLNTNQRVELNIVDLTGRKIEELYNGRLEAGTHEFNLSAEKLANGVYFILYETAQNRATRKFLVIK
ncbi:MAG TPA: T9SS type A sorting domain-containing protein [candidate division WOR-3 bacterium]|uniref:T9SS type A sorting domain-containing protein n=1 Tax=candidate division WOR-3 bacterium TaxID=2052148 RepID=A0A9C9K0K8_UNCW3|nr:T9SS type A sorting domain-containing protein [candidate division WOR-3 bacterium]